MVLAVVLVVAACSDDSASVAEDEPSDSTTTTSTTTTSTTATVTTTTTEPPTLEEQIVANMQGAQSEYLDWTGDAGSGIVFFHNGDWSSEAIELPTGEWCERGTYAWSVADAKSESEFTIHYDTLTEDPDCLYLEITRLTAVYSGSQEVDDRTVYDFTFTEGLSGQLTGTRTVCSDQWNDPEPCGLTLTGFEMSTPPPD